MLNPLGLSKFHRLRRCGLSNAGFTDAPQFPKTLKRLCLVEANLPQGLEEIVGAMEKLTSLRCDGPEFDVTRLLQGIPTDARPHLKCLELAQSYIDISDFIELMRAGLLEHVTHLDLSRNLDVDGKFTATIADTMPNLEVLDLTMTSEINGLTIKSLADTDKLKLRLLYVHKESRANARDAVDYAQKRGLTIACRQKPDRIDAPLGSRFEDL
jgi:hypothetical protein